MKTDVKLQESFSYVKWPWIVLLAIAVAILLTLFVVFLIKRNKNSKKDTFKIVSPKDINSIKAKYLEQLSCIITEVNAGNIDIRTSYYKMSECIRGFIQEATGVNTKSLTLLDAKKMNMPVLERLLEEYYIPEFAYKSAGDINKSINNTRGAIEAWN